MINIIPLILMKYHRTVKKNYVCVSFQLYNANDNFTSFKARFELQLFKFREMSNKQKKLSLILY